MLGSQSRNGAVSGHIVRLNVKIAAARPHDFDPSLSGSVVQDVVSNGKAAQVRGKFGQGAAWQAPGKPAPAGSTQNGPLFAEHLASAPRRRRCLV